jgi:hypothetical protein
MHEALESIPNHPSPKKILKIRKSKLPLKKFGGLAE